MLSQCVSSPLRLNSVLISSHLSTDGPLRGFHSLAIAKTLLLREGGWEHSCVSLSSRPCFLLHCVCSRKWNVQAKRSFSAAFFFLARSRVLCPTAAVPFYTATNSVQGFLLAVHPLPHLISLWFSVNSSRCIGCDVGSPWGFWFASSYWLVMCQASLYVLTPKN